MDLATRQRVWIGALVCLMAACGGGGSPPASPAPTRLSLSVEWSPGATVLRCDTDVATVATIERLGPAPTSAGQMACPGSLVLPGDATPSRWRAELIGRSGATAWPDAVQAAARLPPPVVIRSGDTWLALASPARSASFNIIRLEGVDANGQLLLSVPASGRFVVPPGTPIPHRWRAAATSAGGPYHSDLVATFEPSVTDAGFRGAMAVRRDGAEHVRLVSQGEFPAPIGTALPTERDFRDIRFVDLDNDGHEDIVSNVYGNGCTIIALARATGHDVAVPLRRDGTCIGGHGETILVADFDADGLVDIFLPSYERFDYLRNLGGGRFEEVADDLAISFPAYLPAVEGAAAVDIDRNGSVDIVVANEVLLNDGQGRFTPMAAPFGPTRIFDEGMSVSDLDGDGRFDIVKSDPWLGARIFWGTPDGRFDDAGWLEGGAEVSYAAFGMAVGDFTGDGLLDIVLAGGNDRSGEPHPGPRVCAQSRPRAFDCVSTGMTGWTGMNSDLVLFTDLDGDGFDELLFRQRSLQVGQLPRSAWQRSFVIEAVDGAGRRTHQGRVLTARCALDGSLVGMRFVDGGNGYMAQGRYEVSFVSDWCPRVSVETPGAQGPVLLGQFGPGRHRVTFP